MKNRIACFGFGLVVTVFFSLVPGASAQTGVFTLNGGTTNRALGVSP